MCPYESCPEINENKKCLWGIARDAWNSGHTSAQHQGKVQTMTITSGAWGLSWKCQEWTESSVTLEMLLFIVNR